MMRMLIPAAFGLLLGFGCWVPSIVTHGNSDGDFATHGEIEILTVTLPVLAVAFSFVLGLSVAALGIRCRPAVPMIFGIWITGPTGMFLATMAGGEQQLGGDVIGSIATSTAMFPMATFMMSSYDGSLGGLLIATGVLLALAPCSNRVAGSECQPQ